MTDDIDARIRTKIGSADLAAILRREVLGGERLAGERMPPERKLAEAHGVSRGTAREALSRLEREGLIEIRPGSGAYVIHRPPPASGLPVDSARPMELIDARFALEPHICRLAVLHARPDELARLDALCADMERCADDPVAFAELDALFHDALAQASGNSLLHGMLNEINSARGLDQWRRMRRLTLNRQTIVSYNAHHRRIVEAIRNREPERAATQMKAHLEAARLSLTRAAET